MSIAKHSSQLLPIDIADISLITVFNNLIKINTVTIWQAINRAQAQNLAYQTHGFRTAMMQSIKLAKKHYL